MDQIVMMINYGLIASLALAFVGVTAGFLWLIPRNVRQGQEVRDQLAVRIDTARLAQLLDTMDIDRNKYLHAESISTIHANINECVDCEQNGACVQLADTKAQNQDCPLAENLNQFKSLQSEAA